MFYRFIALIPRICSISVSDSKVVVGKLIQSNAQVFQFRKCACNCMVFSVPNSIAVVQYESVGAWSGLNLLRYGTLLGGN